MDLLAQIGGRLRAFLLFALCAGLVLLDSVSRIISMCVDGFLAVCILALVWPMIRSKDSPDSKQS